MSIVGGQGSDLLAALLANPEALQTQIAALQEAEERARAATKIAQTEEQALSMLEDARRQMADSMTAVVNADNKAGDILAEAQTQADSIIGDAQARAERIVIDAQEIRAEASTSAALLKAQAKVAANEADDMLNGLRLREAEAQADMKQAREAIATASIAQQKADEYVAKWEKVLELMKDIYV